MYVVAVPVALVGVAILTAISVLGKAAETLRAVPISIRPPVASALDLARGRVDAGLMTTEEFLELRRILGE